MKAKQENKEHNPKQNNLKKNIGKTLEALRRLTPTPPPEQLPKSVSADQWADMKNLTDLLDLVAPKKPESPTQTTTPPPVQVTPKLK